MLLLPTARFMSTSVEPGSGPITDNVGSVGVVLLRDDGVGETDGVERYIKGQKLMKKEIS